MMITLSGHSANCVNNCSRISVRSRETELWLSLLFVLVALASFASPALSSCSPIRKWLPRR
jgi:hypothetical protein